MPPTTSPSATPTTTVSRQPPIRRSLINVPPLHRIDALAVYADTDGFWRGTNLCGEGSEHGDESPELLSLRVDLLDLFLRGLVRVAKREQRVRKEKPYRPPSTRRGGSSPFSNYEYVKEALPWPAIPLEISPRDTRLSPEGERLARMMRLHEVPAEERERLVLEHLVLGRREG